MVTAVSETADTAVPQDAAEPQDTAEQPIAVEEQTQGEQMWGKRTYLVLEISFEMKVKYPGGASAIH